jgi:hypothetical protein
LNFNFGKYPGRKTIKDVYSHNIVNFKIVHEGEQMINDGKGSPCQQQLTDVEKQFRKLSN